jgi:hypothetical protein
VDDADRRGARGKWLLMTTYRAIERGSWKVTAKGKHGD